jgi:4-amino-4-deoxy-L-arabinose transferase-like glycosyltransferase
VYDRSARPLIIALLALTAIRVAVASAYPLVDDEAYYWTWSKHLAWGYPDHPPAVAAMVKLTTAMAGDSVVGIRLGPILLAALSSLLIYDLGRRMFDRRTAMFAAAGYQIIPVAAVGGIFTFPDAPFIFCWILAVWCVWRAREFERAWDWYAAGLAVGLALLSKLTALFLVLSFVGFFLAHHRRWLRRAEPYRAAAIAIAVILPFIAWNRRHDWITFVKTLNPVPWIDLGEPAWNAAAFLGATAAYHGPIVFGLLVAALLVSIRLAIASDSRYALLSWLATPLIGFTLLSSFDGIPKPHWPAPAYLMLVLAAAALWPRVRTHRWWRAAAIGGTTLNAALVVGLYATPFLPLSPAGQHLVGWDRAAATAAEIIRKGNNRNWFVLTASYQNASQVAYHLRERYPVTTPRQDNAIAMSVNPISMLDRDAVFVTDHHPGPGLPLHLMFRRVERRPDVEVRAGSGVRRFQVYVGYGFRGLPQLQITPL